jgi:hypothetical protein
MGRMDREANNTATLSRASGHVNGLPFLLQLSLPRPLPPLRLDRGLECLLNGFGEELRNRAFQGSGEFKEFLVGHPSAAVLDLRHHIARNIPTLELAFGGEFRLADFNFVA